MKVRVAHANAWVAHAPRVLVSAPPPKRTWNSGVPEVNAPSRSRGGAPLEAPEAGALPGDLPRTRGGLSSAFQFKISLPGMLVALASFLATTLLAVEMPSIRLDTVIPPGGKAGTDVEVTITGGDLEELDALHFSQPGITAKLKGDKTFSVNIAADVPPGTYDARISGLSGVSNPRAFVVGNLPEAKKAKTNNRPEDALDLPMDSVISGSVLAGQNDYFKFSARKGERVIIECAAAEIDSRLRPVLALLDAEGQELQVSRRDGLLDFAPATEGSYLIKLSDLTFAGDAEHFYRLSITHAPHIDFAAPSSVPAGTKRKFTLYGRNLPRGAVAQFLGNDGKTLEWMEVEAEAPSLTEIRSDDPAPLPAAGVDGFLHRFSIFGVTSNPVFVGLSGIPSKPEENKNRAAAQAQKITLPCEIDGDFSCGNETHWFTFDAKKGEVWWIETLSHRIGMRTNPTIIVKHGDEDLAAVMGADAGAGPKRFNTGSNDPAWRFEAKADGAYRVGVADLFGGAKPSIENLHDSHKAFRLSIHKETPDFRLAAFFEPPPEKADDKIAVPNAPLVRAGGVAAIRVFAFRRDNFSGDIELSAEGLPAGVSCVPTKILSGKNDGWLLLAADEKPERWVGCIRVIGKAKAGDANLIHEARGGVIVWGVQDIGTARVQTRLTCDIALAVSAKEAAPVSVRPAEDKIWEVTPGGKLDIPIKITRRGEFKDALKLKGAGAPGIETLKEVDVPPGAADAKVTIDLASVKIPAGDHTIYFQSPTKGKFRGKDVSTTVFSVPIRIAIKAPEAKQP